MLPPAESPPPAIFAGSITMPGGGVVKAPADEGLDLLDLHRILRLRRELLVHCVCGDAGALSDDPHRLLS
jgi:hypothetical protein